MGPTILHKQHSHLRQRSTAKLFRFGRAPAQVPTTATTSYTALLNEHKRCNTSSSSTAEDRCNAHRWTLQTWLRQSSIASNRQRVHRNRHLPRSHSHLPRTTLHLGINNCSRHVLTRVNMHTSRLVPLPLAPENDWPCRSLPCRMRFRAADNQLEGRSTSWQISEHPRQIHPCGALLAKQASINSLRKLQRTLLMRLKLPYQTIGSLLPTTVRSRCHLGKLLQETCRAPLQLQVLLRGIKAKANLIPTRSQAWHNHIATLHLTGKLNICASSSHHTYNGNRAVGPSRHPASASRHRLGLLKVLLNPCD